MPRSDAIASLPQPALPDDGVQVLDLATGKLTRQERALAVEMPVNVVYAPIPFAVMMTTPQDLEDFAYGFSFTEGIIDRPQDIRSVAVEEGEGGLRLVISLASEKMQRHLARGRNIAGRTGCGLCGIDDLKSMPKAKEIARPKQDVELAAINRALKDIVAAQQLNKITQSVHAAAWCRRNGEIAAIREDVGRHNALDKLIGAALRNGFEPDDGFLLLTSRASFEMIEKAAIFGARTVVNISAPTSLAVRRARDNGITLIAMARNGSALVFSGADRIRTESRVSGA